MRIYLKVEFERDDLGEGHVNELTQAIAEFAAEHGIVDSTISCGLQRRTNERQGTF